MDALTIKLHGTQIEEARQAFSHRWADLDKKAKANEAAGIKCDAREKMAVLEEIIRSIEPQADLLDGIEHPPEAY